MNVQAASVRLHGGFARHAVRHEVLVGMQAGQHEQFEGCRVTERRLATRQFDLSLAMRRHQHIVHPERLIHDGAEGACSPQRRQMR